MSKNNVVKLAGRDAIIDPLTELLRTGAEQLVYQAVEAELLELLAERIAIRHSWLLRHQLQHRGLPFNLRCLRR